MIFISLKNLSRSEQHSHAHNLLGKLLNDMYGIDYFSEKTAKSEYGKPFMENFPDIRYNISHADGITVCCAGNCECGIDAEPVRKYRPPVVRRAFSEKEKLFLELSKNQELDFFRLWTLKESYVKAIGIGVSYPLKTVEFDLSGSEIVCSMPDCKFHQYILQNRFVVSHCVLT